MRWLSQLTERPVYCRDEIGKPTGLDRMMPYITPDYFCREMRIDLFSVHDILPKYFLKTHYYGQKIVEREFSALLPEFDRHRRLKEISRLYLTAPMLLGTF
jgi:hypothetical protein